MRNKVNLQWLKSAQTFSSRLNHPLLPQIYSHYYQYVHQFITDIRKPFSSLCIHGNYPHQPLTFLKKSNHFKNIFSVSNISQTETSNVLQNKTIQIFEEHEKFDLIISCMEMHKYPNYEDLLQKYKNSLKPDGALIGCCFGEKTLSSLSKAYLLAQNQRYGGVSPKLLNFPSIGMFGNSLSTIKFELPTIITNDLQIQFQSVTDLLTLLQLGGESGIVKGRRKGAYKDLLLAMGAIYDSEQKGEEQKVCRQKIEVISFIGWKYDETQTKPLKRRKLEEKTFIGELKKYDPELKQYKIDDGGDDFTQIK